MVWFKWIFGIREILKLNLMLTNSVTLEEMIYIIHNNLMFKFVHCTDSPDNGFIINSIIFYALNTITRCKRYMNYRLPSPSNCLISKLIKFMPHIPYRLQLIQYRIEIGLCIISNLILSWYQMKCDSKPDSWNHFQGLDEINRLTILV